jgi:hypothetical protein
MLDAMPFEIEGSGITAVATDTGVLVAFAGAGDAKMFRRRPQRMRPNGSTERIEMLVAELNGVRAYFRRGADSRLEVVISTMNLQP